MGVSQIRTVRRLSAAAVEQLLGSARAEEVLAALRIAVDPELAAARTAADELAEPAPAVGWLVGMPASGAMPASRLEEGLAADLSALGASAEQAVAGVMAAAEQYVRQWQALARSTLAAVRRVRPELPLDGGAAALHLLWGAAEAPFSGWVASRGPAEGVALSLVERIRSLIPDARPLPAPPSALPAWQLSEDDWLRFHFRVEAALRAVAGATADLERARELFDLSLTELGVLFGASRQAATKWLHEGLPVSRRPKAATVVALGELLERKLRPGRLPAVARRAAEAYGGRTMLERIAAGEHERLLAEVRDSFDWAATA